MTIAQQLEQRGIEKGIEKGKLEVARAMLHRGMALSTVMALTGLTSAILAQIDHLYSK